MIFAALVLPREPLQWGQFYGAVHLWLQNAGAIAALALGIWLLAQLLRRGKPFADLLADAPASLAGSLSAVLSLLVGVAFLGYLAAAIMGLASALGARSIAALLPRAGRDTLTVGDYVLSVSGLMALTVALMPMFLGLARMRWGRIWALARLSIKEAVRSRVVLVFAFMALVFLFADWFVPYRAEDQVRNYVRVVYWSMTPLFLMTAGLLGALSIPNDIKSQSIHTIVTKPVEKFEIVLGRFLGYAMLLSVGLAAISLLSLVYVLRGVNDAAKEESFKARVPIFGELSFVGTTRTVRDAEGREHLMGDSVGREFDYRGYITGPHVTQRDAPRQYAIWSFDDVPAELGRRESSVTFEFTFDIFRLSKGEENKDIPCTFVFAEGSLSLADVNERLAKIQEERVKRPVGALPEELFEKQLIEKYSIYEAAGVPVTDYHTQSLDVPVAFFQKLLAAPARRDDAGSLPRMKVVVSVDRAAETQMLGVARRDLYLLADSRPFWVNFLKGIAGMWCTHMLVLGVAVACSTYLSGIISFLCTMLLYVAGMFIEYLQHLSENRPGEGGGPAEAFYRVTTGKVMAAPLDQGPATTVLKGADDVFTWSLRRVLNLIPDVNRFDLHPYVANGFDVSFTNLLIIDNLIPLIGYLVPWGILAYYLMKYREIANPT
jgi:hypothetical protein